MSAFSCSGADEVNANERRKGPGVMQMHVYRVSAGGHFLLFCSSGGLSITHSSRSCYCSLHKVSSVFPPQPEPVCPDHRKSPSKKAGTSLHRTSGTHFQKAIHVSIFIQTLVSSFSVIPSVL